jgi:hypothetical protein
LSVRLRGILLSKSEQCRVTWCCEVKWYNHSDPQRCKNGVWWLSRIFRRHKRWVSFAWEYRLILNFSACSL